MPARAQSLSVKASARRGSRGTTVRKSRTTLLPEAMRRFLQQRALDAFALLLIALALTVAAALLTYDRRDPSHNHAIEGPAHNALSLPGAWVADLLLTTLGVAAGWLVLAIGTWGLLILLRRPLHHWWLRIIGLLAGTLLSAIWLSFLPATVFDTLGGSLGDVLRQDIIHLVARFLGGAAPAATGIFSLMVSITLLMLVSGIRLGEWRRGGSSSIGLVRTLASWRPAPSLSEPVAPTYADDLLDEADEPAPVPTRKTMPSIKRPVLKQNPKQEAKRARDPNCCRSISTRCRRSRCCRWPRRAPVRPI